VETARIARERVLASNRIAAEQSTRNWRSTEPGARSGRHRAREALKPAASPRRNASARSKSRATRGRGSRHRFPRSHRGSADRQEKKVALARILSEQETQGAGHRSVPNRSKRLNCGGATRSSVSVSALNCARSRAHCLQQDARKCSILTRSGRSSSPTRKRSSRCRRNAPSASVPTARSNRPRSRRRDVETTEVARDQAIEAARLERRRGDRATRSRARTIPAGSRRSPRTKKSSVRASRRIAASTRPASGAAGFAKTGRSIASRKSKRP